MNYTDITTICNNASEIGNKCVYVYGSDHIIFDLSVIAGCLIFIVVYILYKEIVQ